MEQETDSSVAQAQPPTQSLDAAKTKRIEQPDDRHGAPLEETNAEAQVPKTKDDESTPPAGVTGTSQSLGRRQPPRVRPLDGLRALAILAVLAYHMRLPWLPSGHLGVVVFLVLSGYLATNSVASLYDKQQGVHLRDLFRIWWYRLRRLWPSVAALVAITGTLCAFLNHVLLTKMRPDALPSLGFFQNWAYILRGSSYFEQIGGSSPLLHLWYLGVDLQFFLAWTLVLALLLKGGRRLARWVALILAIASAAWMIYLYIPGSDPSRVYYGTDTRAFALLLGSWLALAFPLGKVPQVGKRLLVTPFGEHRARGKARRYRATAFAHLAGLASIAAIGAAVALLPGDSPLYFQGGMAAVAVLATVLVATLLSPGSFMGKILSFPLLTYIGTRSFALYLWHYPIFLLMAANKTTTPWEWRIAAVLVSLVAAELSLQLVEKPFSFHKDEAKRPSTARLAVTALLVAATGAYAAYALVTIPDESLVPEEALVSTGAAADEAQQVAKPNEATRSDATTESKDEDKNAADANVASDGTTAKEDDSAKTDDKASKVVTVTQDTVVSAAPSETAAGLYDPVLIGDSVPGDAEWSYRLPNGLIDTYIGRQPFQALEVLRGYLDQGVVGKVVVFACFSNSTPYLETLDNMVAACGPDRQVFLVGTVNPDGFQDAANQNLLETAAKYDNVTYVDWPAVLDGHLEEYLWADATHLRPEGAVVYVDMVVRAIAQTMVDAGGSAVG